MQFAFAFVEEKSAMNNKKWTIDEIMEKMEEVDRQVYELKGPTEKKIEEELAFGKVLTESDVLKYRDIVAKAKVEWDDLHLLQEGVQHDASNTHLRWLDLYVRFCEMALEYKMKKLTLSKRKERTIHINHLRDDLLSLKVRRITGWKGNINIKVPAISADDTRVDWERVDDFIKKLEKKVLPSWLNALDKKPQVLTFRNMQKIQREFDKSGYEVYSNPDLRLKAMYEMRIEHIVKIQLIHHYLDAVRLRGRFASDEHLLYAIRWLVRANYSHKLRIADEELDTKAKASQMYPIAREDKFHDYRRAQLRRLYPTRPNGTVISNNTSPRKKTNGANLPGHSNSNGTRSSSAPRNSPRANRAATIASKFARVGGLGTTHAGAQIPASSNGKPLPSAKKKENRSRSPSVPKKPSRTAELAATNRVNRAAAKYVGNGGVAGAYSIGKSAQTARGGAQSSVSRNNGGFSIENVKRAIRASVKVPNSKTAHGNGRREPLKFIDPSGHEWNCGYRAYLLGKSMVQNGCIAGKYQNDTCENIMNEIKTLRKNANNLGINKRLESERGEQSRIPRIKASIEDIDAVAQSHGINVVFVLNVPQNFQFYIGSKRTKHGLLMSYADFGGPILNEYGKDIDKGMYPPSAKNTIFIQLINDQIARPSQKADEAGFEHFRLIVPESMKFCDSLAV